MYLIFISTKYELYLIGLLRVNEILVHFAIDGVLDLIRFSNVRMHQILSLAQIKYMLLIIIKLSKFTEINSLFFSPLFSLFIAQRVHLSAIL